MFNLIASQSSRTSDVQMYPSHRAYLWADRLGSSKLHAKLAVGGFGGVSPFGGHKLFVRGLAEAYVYGRTYKVIDLEYMIKGNLSQNSSVSGYGKICGSTYINPGIIPFTYSKSYPMLSMRVFYTKISFYILWAKKNVYFEGSITGNLTFAVNVGLPSTTTSLAADPTVTVTAGAYLKVLVSLL